MNGESSLHQPVVLELVASKSRYNLRQEYEGVTPCTHQIKGILRIGQPSKHRTLQGKPFLRRKA